MAICSTACSYTPSMTHHSQQKPSPAKEQTKLRWHLSKSEPKAVILVTHGLNAKAATMNELIKYFNTLGLHALLVTLHGHNSNSNQTLANVSLQDWEEDIKSGYAEIKARYPKMPIYALGFSLGGTVILNFLLNNPEAEIEKLILLSPAIKLTFFASLMRMITPLHFLGIALPSENFETYRVHPWVPLTAYRALLSAINKLEKIPKTKNTLQKIPALVILNHNDEFIAGEKTREWIELHRLSLWQFAYIQSKPEIPNCPKHLIFRKEAVGETAWKEMLIKFRNFLSKQTTTKRADL